MKKILVVAAHPDDELLGVGGTIARLVHEGVECHCVILGEGITARGNTRSEFDGTEQKPLLNDARRAAKRIGYSSINFCGLPDVRFDSIELLDIVKLVQKYIQEIKPDTIFTHHYGDLNIDHRYTYDAVMCANRPTGESYAKRVLCFETLSSTEWRFGQKEKAFYPNVFVNITEYFDDKWEALSCYRGEMRDYPHPRSKEALEAYAKKWGSTVNLYYAEAFEEVINII